MSTEITVAAAPVVSLVGFGDLAAFQKRLADAVKGAFGSLIPEDALSRVIEAEWKRFVEEVPETRDRWGNVQKVGSKPELPGLVHEEMKRQVLIKIDEWGKEWAKSAECSAMARQVIVDAANEAAKTWQQNLGLSIVQQVMAAVPSVFACKNCGNQTVRGQSCGRCGNWQQ